MKTFTVRQMDREPATILDACDKSGAVRIRRRDGRTYTVRAELTSRRMRKVPNFAERMASAFPKRIPAAQASLADKLLGGE